MFKFILSAADLPHTGYGDAESLPKLKSNPARGDLKVGKSALVGIDFFGEGYLVTDNLDLIELTSDIVSSHVTHNHVAVGDLPNLIQQVHGALAGLRQMEPAPEQDQKEPAVSIKASMKRDFLICLECGKKQKTLKRHLGRAHNVTPAQYRAQFGLPADYPMVAPSYSERRSDMAKSIGLGRKPGSAEAIAPAPSADAAQPAQKRVSRQKKAA